MPRVNIYIRNEDWEAWENIPDKPGWIHEGLTSGIVMIPARSIPETIAQTKKKLFLKSPEEVIERQKVTGDRCDHGFNLKVSKCKYGCKKGA